MSGSGHTAGDAGLTAGVGVPRAGAASLLPSGITWLIENRGHPIIKQNQIGLEGTQ